MLCADEDRKALCPQWPVLCRNIRKNFGKYWLDHNLLSLNIQQLGLIGLNCYTSALDFPSYIYAKWCRIRKLSTLDLYFGSFILYNEANLAQNKVCSPTRYSTTSGLPALPLTPKCATAVLFDRTIILHAPKTFGRTI